MFNNKGRFGSLIQAGLMGPKLTQGRTALPGELPEDMFNINKTKAPPVLGMGEALPGAMPSDMFNINKTKTPAPTVAGITAGQPLPPAAGVGTGQVADMQGVFNKTAPEMSDKLAMMRDRGIVKPGQSNFKSEMLMQLLGLA